MHAGKAGIIRMLEKFGNDMARGEIFSPASFAYSPSPGIISVHGTHTGAGTPSGACKISPSEAIADAAVSSLLGEVWTTPKPGLVDRNNNGSHRDMNLAMFEASAASLHGSFCRCAEAGIRLKDDLPALAAELRIIGLQAEQQMYAVTGGVNTHKGAIFSMGVLCAASAMELPQEDVRDPSTGLIAFSDGARLTKLQTNCSAIASALLEKDTASGTHGLAVRETTGTGGIRKEALSGFETAFSLGLTALEEALAAGCSEKASMVYALLRIMAATEDSNLVHRGGAEGMNFAKKEAVRLTESGPAQLDLDAVYALDEEFIKRNLSPGGSADLLAFSGMLYRLKKGIDYD